MSEYGTLWSREQAELLRRMGAGERLNDQVDWEHVAEEIESLGNSDRRDVRSRIHTVLLPSARSMALLDLADFDEQPSADPAGLAFSDAQVLGPWLPD